MLYLELEFKKRDKAFAVKASVCEESRLIDWFAESFF